MTDASSMHETGNMNLPAKRGPGRPPGSTNKPQLSPYEKATIRRELGPAYIDAVMIRMKADVKARGLRTLITSKLGREELAQIEADIIVEVENEMTGKPEEASSGH